MDRFNDEIDRVLPGRLCVCGKPIGWRDKLVRIRLRAGVRTYIINRLPK